MEDHNFFYRDVPTLDLYLAELLAKEDLFEKVPESWQIIVLDVKDSTGAVVSGLHHEVNLAATGGVIAVLNKIKSINKKLVIPYFFGGDGATFIIPESICPEISKVIDNYRHHVSKTSSLTLRTGIMQVKEVYANERSIKIAKLKINNRLVLPIVLGNGLKFAEDRIKSRFVNDEQEIQPVRKVNLQGMECRWQEIQPPAHKDKIVCLVINCPDEDQQAKVYHELVVRMDRILGKYDKRQPITIQRLKLDLTIKKITKEMYAKLGRYSLFYLIKNLFITRIGKYYFRYFKDGKKYLKTIRELSHSVMLDGTFHTVISCKDEQIDELVVFLDHLENEQKIQYGIHITHGSILSCYIENRNSKHIHFVDGTEGGYTTAAMMFKRKVEN